MTCEYCDYGGNHPYTIVFDVFGLVCFERCDNKLVLVNDWGWEGYPTEEGCYQ